MERSTLVAPSRPSSPSALESLLSRWADDLLVVAAEIGGTPLARRLAPLPAEERVLEIRRAAGVDSSPREARVDSRGVVVSLVKL